ncbi:uncharacterized protein LOC110981167 [Acanthaster planci]|uniref:Uncharacterized protein LOC110981167 n=1 Tax=Acanthaster planci TaxID=133434 RepID=A0A8B7YLN1_ACAPL|nr:uncharacterized protein LOC110981167 [Acanthaster planci]
MLPKNTTTTAMAMLPEKSLALCSGKKDTEVVSMVEDKDLQVSADFDRGRTRRAVICSCAVVLTTLILVAGALGAVAIVITQSDRVTTVTGPSRGSPLDRNSLAEIPATPPRVKIDNGGLWPPGPPTPDRVTVNGSSADSDDEDLVVSGSSGEGPTQLAIFSEQSGSVDYLSSQRQSSSDSVVRYFSDMYYDSW